MHLDRVLRYLLAILAACSLFCVTPVFGGPQTMVHAHYNGSAKLNLGGMTLNAYHKKICDDLYQRQARVNIVAAATGQPRMNTVSPFRVSGRLDDLETFTEDVYILTEQGWHATHKHGYTLQENKHTACDFKVIPHEEWTIVYYKQGSVYKFDSVLPEGQQWVRSELPNGRMGRHAANSMTTLLGFSVTPTGRRDLIANLFCEGSLLTSPHPDFKSNACIWRAKREDHLQFLGFPLELVLSSQTQVAKNSIATVVAETVVLNAPYIPDVFQLPESVINMPFYAGAPGSLKSENEYADLDCIAEKRRTGINPCNGKAAFTEWCAVIVKRTGKNPCLAEDEEFDDE
jgi:hypothetical protein